MRLVPLQKETLESVPSTAHQGKAHLKTRQEGGLQARKRVVTRTQICLHLAPELQNCECPICNMTFLQPQQTKAQLVEPQQEQTDGAGRAVWAYSI